MNKHQERFRAFARNAPQGGQWFRMKVDETAKAARVDLYDEIGGWFGVTAKDFTKQLNALDVETIELHVNSPGGDVFDGIAITNALRQHKARVVATVDGLAASAASFIVMGADEVVMAKNSELFIHDAWGFGVGNAADMRKLGDDLDRISNNIASMYADKAGGDAPAWRALMEAETWYSAEEAVEAGLADRVEAKREDEDIEAPAKAAFDLSVFAHAGRANAPAPRTPAASASGTRTTRTPEGGTAVAFSDEQLTTLRQRVGVASDADEATILAAIDEALTERAEPQSPAAAAVPEGMALVDAATLAALRDDATAGRAARNRQLEQERATIVDSAINDGRIPPARREHWLNQLTADPGAEQVLASLSPGLVPLSEVGDSGTQVRNQAGSEDDTYRTLFPQEG